MREYDIIAIGGGSGGIATMNRAGEHGAKAAVIEANKLGGTCVNMGCVPKKIMWYGAQIAESIHKYGPDYGFTSTGNEFDYATLRQNREAYIDRARSSYDGSFKRNGVDLIEGRAEFVDAHTLSVNGELIRAKHIVIATGAHPHIPAIPGAELGGSSDDVFAWEELPESVAILGAGYIAVELAGVLHTLGVQTDLFVRRERPLRRFDSYIVESLVQEMENTGLNLTRFLLNLKKLNKALPFISKMAALILPVKLSGLLVAVQTLKDFNLKKQVLLLMNVALSRLMNTRTQSLTESTLLEMSQVKRN